MVRCPWRNFAALVAWRKEHEGARCVWRSNGDASPCCLAVTWAVAANTGMLAFRGVKKAATPPIAAAYGAWWREG